MFFFLLDARHVFVDAALPALKIDSPKNLIELFFSRNTFSLDTTHLKLITGLKISQMPKKCFNNSIQLIIMHRINPSFFRCCCPVLNNLRCCRLFIYHYDCCIVFRTHFIFTHERYLYEIYSFFFVFSINLIKKLITYG